MHILKMYVYGTQDQNHTNLGFLNLNKILGFSRITYLSAGLPFLLTYFSSKYGMIFGRSDGFSGC